MFGKPKAECGQPSAKKLGCEEADNHCEEANTFNEGTDDDHWGLDLADSLWLTSHGVHGRRTNLTETPLLPAFFPALARFLHGCLSYRRHVVHEHGVLFHPDAVPSR